MRVEKDFSQEFLDPLHGFRGQNVHIKFSDVSKIQLNVHTRGSREYLASQLPLKLANDNTQNTWGLTLQFQSLLVHSCSDLSVIENSLRFSMPKKQISSKRCQLNLDSSPFLKLAKYSKGYQFASAQITNLTTLPMLNQQISLCCQF